MKNEIAANDYLMFRFIFYRDQTRYTQDNYKKTSYTEESIEKVIDLSLQDMIKIDKALASINYETTREKYTAAEQRKLMTPALKRQIKERDNFTCQKCGKYMPDEVGLHVDHKISIKNGGKSVPSNLWVLCDKCNLGKGRKNVDGTNKKYNDNIDEKMFLNIEEKGASGSDISSADRIISRELSKKLGNKYSKTINGNIAAQLGKSIMGTFFK